MADFRTSSHRERWIFQPHDLVSPALRVCRLLCYALARPGACSDLVTIRRARPWCCASQTERWAAANQRATETLAQVGSRWFIAVAVIT